MKIKKPKMAKSPEVAKLLRKTARKAFPAGKPGKMGKLDYFDSKMK